MQDQGEYTLTGTDIWLYEYYMSSGIVKDITEQVSSIYCEAACICWVISKHIQPAKDQRLWPSTSAASKCQNTTPAMVTY